ncbi:hypothetical protein Tsubulata_043149 [Turnera subulata]|uniref:DUF7787 domain-containing protein n=1 Tax=Turnera subulata TaxID=218843 RepID=A0A9Q0FPL5_9ROSI|nr:hypothetical protein Tsubulata_043149 [Turnera subulata]
MRRKSQALKIPLEDYLHFLDFRNHKDLSVNFLNQIIGMHGFKKIHRTPKRVLVEALGGVELVKPWRSTVGEEEGVGEREEKVRRNVEEVIADLKELDWQECCVTSLQSIPTTLSLAHTLPPLPPSSARTKRKRSNRNNNYSSTVTTTATTIPTWAAGLGALPPPGIHAATSPAAAAAAASHALVSFASTSSSSSSP